MRRTKLQISNNMNILIRQDLQDDHQSVFSLVEQASMEMEFSNPDEQFLVKRMRKS